jgi:ubiquinone/menaquinone biosynthesis C-methylase UbiE
MQKTDVIQQWSESAPYWEKHRETIREMFSPVTRALIEDARISSGQSVLDVAMGPGEPALTIAEVVGPEGRLVGTDAVAEMVEAARREGLRRKLDHSNFEVAFAGNLPFPPDTFDAVVSRFGVMFFPAPVNAVRECLRVLKPGGKIAMAVWHFAENNPFHYVVAEVVDQFAKPVPPEPDAPDAFRFATPGKLKAVFSEAGVDAISERLLRFPIRTSISVEDFWTMRREMSEKLRSKLATLSNDQLTELGRDVMEAVNGFTSDGVISFPAEVLVVSGRKHS